MMQEAFVYFSELIWDPIPKLGLLEELDSEGFVGHFLFRFNPPLFYIDGQASEYLGRRGCEENAIVIRPRYGEWTGLESEPIDFSLVPKRLLEQIGQRTARDLLPMGPAVLFFNGPGVRERVDAQIAGDLRMDAQVEATLTPDQVERILRAKREYL